MLKKVLAATAMLAIAGSSLVYAQQRAGGPDGPGGRDRGPDRRPGAERYQPTQEDMSAFADARIAAMKAGLKLTPDQEKNWPAFESAYRDLAKQSDERAERRREAFRNRDNGQQQRPTGDMMDFMQRRAETMSKSADAFKHFAETAAPLYRSLDDGQKRRFGVLTRILRPHLKRMARGEEHGRFEGRGPNGFERGGRPRFGAAQGMGGNQFAAIPPAEPDLNALADREAD